MKRWLLPFLIICALWCDRAAHAQPANVGYFPHDAGGTITTGGSFQLLFNANSARLGCLVQNPSTASEIMVIYFMDAAPTVAKSFTIKAGDSFNCQYSGATVTGPVYVEAATTGHAFAAAGS